MFYPNFGFALLELLFPLMFLLVFGFLLVNLFQGLKESRRNNKSPRLTVPVTVVAKRDQVSRHRGANGHSHRTTRYYATFQVESGDRLELQLQGQEYGLIVEGDRGNLTFQGTRFLSFERTL